MNFNVGWNPQEWTANEKKLYESVPTEWTLAAQIQKSFPEWSMHTVNNTLRRLHVRGVVEKKEDKALKRMFYRRIDE